MERAVDINRFGNDTAEYQDGIQIRMLLQLYLPYLRMHANKLG
jgi:hypothetical protein